MSEAQPGELARLRAELALTQRHAHEADADRAEAEAQLHRSKAELAAAHARAARSQAEAASSAAAVRHFQKVWTHWFEDERLDLKPQEVLEAVRCDLRDALNLASADGRADPMDAAWGAVWLHGKWDYLTDQMSVPARELAADAVARWAAALSAEDGDLEAGELKGLRWWRE